MPDTEEPDETAADTDADDAADSDDSADSEQEVHDYEDKSDTDVFVDRDKIDFDPDDGLLSGTAIDGGTDIPGPHENVDDVEADGDAEESAAEEESDDPEEDKS